MLVNRRNGMDALPFCKVTLQRKRSPRGLYYQQLKGYPANPTNIGEMIRKRRLDLNLRQIDVAQLIGCDEMTVVNWEKGHTMPRINCMAGVIEFLVVSPLPDSATLAQRLVNHRTTRGLTQKEFARRIGVDPGTLSRWERGNRLPEGEFLTAVEAIIS